MKRKSRKDCTSKKTKITKEIIEKNTLTDLFKACPTLTDIERDTITNVYKHRPTILEATVRALQKYLLNQFSIPNYQGTPMVFKQKLPILLIEPKNFLYAGFKNTGYIQRANVNEFLCKLAPHFIIIMTRYNDFQARSKCRYPSVISFSFRFSLMHRIGKVWTKSIGGCGLSSHEVYFVDTEASVDEREMGSLVLVPPFTGVETTSLDVMYEHLMEVKKTKAKLTQTIWKCLTQDEVA